MQQVQLYSRKGCHLCEDALHTLRELQNELAFEIEEIDVDANDLLQAKYGDLVPVIHINNVHHDFYRVDPVRFRKALT